MFIVTEYAALSLHVLEFDVTIYTVALPRITYASVFQNMFVETKAIFQFPFIAKLHFIPLWNCLSRAYHNCSFKLHLNLFEIP